MADLTIRERLWNDFSAVAKKRHKRPETLAQELIQEYIQRVVCFETYRCASGTGGCPKRRVAGSTVKRMALTGTRMSREHFRVFAKPQTRWPRRVPQSQTPFVHFSETISI